MVRQRTGHRPEDWRWLGKGYAVPEHPTGGPLTLDRGGPTRQPGPRQAPRRLPRYPDEVIWEAVASEGSQAAAARLLGITENRIYLAMRNRH